MVRRRKRSLARVGNALLFVGLLVGLAAIGFVLGQKFGPKPPSTPPLKPAAPDQPAPPSAVTPPAPEGPLTLLTAGTTETPIIMYHDVLPDKQVWFDMTTDEFTQQMNDLAAAGAHPVSLQELYDHLKSNKPLPDHAIILTFDDCTLGHFTDALPILKQHGFHAIFFVQTASVGVTTEKKHMTWDQLRQAEATGLITVESHTVTHPEDITTLSDSDLDREMQESKQTLETKLGHPVPFLAYPSGHCDARIQQAAIRAGYIAAVTMDRGWAASPAQSYFLPRFTPKRVPEIIAAWRDEGPKGPPTPRLVQVSDSPLERGTFDGGNVTVQWIAGGDLGTQALNGRKTVGEIALQNNAQAALNGTFFADARVASTASAMIGPVLCRADNNYAPAEASEDPRLEGRPLVLVGGGKCLVLPYAEHLGHSLEVLQSLLPDVKDAFLAGGWIVHAGKAVDPELMRVYSTADAQDARHRAFVGIDAKGHYMLGATQDSVSTAILAGALERMGVQEAWLMDSGFSTSLIWQNHVLVSGHFNKDVPSRPVPHALFLLGQCAPDAPPPPADSRVAAGPGAATTEQALLADSGIGEKGYLARTHTRTHRRRTHHHRVKVAAPDTAPAPAATTPPDSAAAPQAPSPTP